jgi:hypothetical protein
VATTINPLLLTGNNPTGANLGNPLAIMDFAQQGPNALIPNIGTSGSAASTPQNNPYVAGTGGTVPGSATPMTAPSTTPFPANSGAVPSGPIGASPTGSGFGTGINSSFGGMSPAAWTQLWNSLKKTYGPGVAGALQSFLEGGAGFNQNAINNLFAALQPGIQQGEENIMEQFSAEGNRFGSPAAAGEANFLSQVNLNEGTLETGMYEQSIQDFLSILTGAANTTAKRIASTPSTLDQVLSALKLGGSAGQGVSAGISAANPNADTAVLDAIAGAAAGL